MTRPNKVEYYLSIAEAVALRSTCLRRQYGAVAVKDDVIVSTGYNGSARGDVNCIDAGECWREANNVPHGERYELCRAVHAEMNAVINGNREDLYDSVLYLAGWENGKQMKDHVEPCLMCKRVLRNAGVHGIVYRDTSCKSGYKFCSLEREFY